MQLRRKACFACKTLGWVDVASAVCVIARARLGSACGLLPSRPSSRWAGMRSLPRVKENDSEGGLLVSSIHYVLDSSAIVHNPEILAFARTARLEIPAGVLEEIRSREDKWLKKTISGHLRQALDAGVTVLERPVASTLVRLAGPLSARLSPVDQEIAAAALMHKEYAKQVCVVTTDKGLVSFLEGVGVRSCNPGEFLQEQKSRPPKADEALMTSAEVVSKTQRQYLNASFAGGAALASVVFVAYLNAGWLLNTIPAWGPFLVAPALGFGLFAIRQRARLAYGSAELLVGIGMSAHVVFPPFDYAAVDMKVSLQFIAGLYVIVRGLDNIGVGIKGTKHEGLWNGIFGG